MKQLTFAKAGMPAMALAFIIAAALAGCPLDSVPEPEPQPGPGPGGDPALTGSVFISGFAQVGGMLTADTSGLEGTGALEYGWKRGAAAAAVDTAIDGAAGNTYTLVAADLNQYLTVTRSGYTGSVRSAPTAQVAAPDTQAPVVSGVTVSPGTANLAKGAASSLALRLQEPGWTPILRIRLLPGPSWSRVRYKREPLLTARASLPWRLGRPRPA